MVIFNSYVSLPEGMYICVCVCIVGFFHVGAMSAMIPSPVHI